MNQSHRFWFTLSLALGQPVSVLQRLVDSREFSEWIVFNSVEPIGERREDIRCASLAHVFASCFSKHPPPIKDFIVDYWAGSSSSQKMSGEEMLALFKRSVRK